jgi:hypothetical protein
MKINLNRENDSRIRNLPTTKQECWPLAIVGFFTTHILEAVDTITCSLVKVNRRFRGTKLNFPSCLLQADFFVWLTLELKTGVTCYSETSEFGLYAIIFQKRELFSVYDNIPALESE